MARGGGWCNMSNAPFEYTEDGRLVINMDTTAADSDWLRAARLKRLAEGGDKDAARKLAEMEATEMVEIPDLSDAIGAMLAKAALGSGEKADHYDDWHDPRMSKEEWIAETSVVGQPQRRKYWYSVHSHRGPLAKDHLAGLPIGLLVLDENEVKTYYLPQFADEQRAIKNQIRNSRRPAAREIRYRFDDPDMYGDWFSLDKTEVDYESADSLGRHFLREFERFWD